MHIKGHTEYQTSCIQSCHCHLQQFMHNTINYAAASWGTDLLMDRN